MNLHDAAEEALQKLVHTMQSDSVDALPAAKEIIELYNRDRSQQFYEKCERARLRGIPIEQVGPEKHDLDVKKQRLISLTNSQRALQKHIDTNQRKFAARQTEIDELSRVIDELEEQP
jgi:hypothetical protein